MGRVERDVRGGREVQVEAPVGGPEEPAGPGVVPRVPVQDPPLRIELHPPGPELAPDLHGPLPVHPLDYRVLGLRPPREADGDGHAHLPVPLQPEACPVAPSGVEDLHVLQAVLHRPVGVEPLSEEPVQLHAEDLLGHGLEVL